MIIDQARQIACGHPAKGLGMKGDAIDALHGLRRVIGTARHRQLTAHLRHFVLKAFALIFQDAHTL